MGGIPPSKGNQVRNSCFAAGCGSTEIPCAGEILWPVPRMWGKADDDSPTARSIASGRHRGPLRHRGPRHRILAPRPLPGHAALRDAAKREALTNASVALIEVPARYYRDGVAGEVKRLPLRHGRPRYRRWNGAHCQEALKSIAPPTQAARNWRPHEGRFVASRF